jgi:hypothetical protein
MHSKGETEQHQILHKDLWGRAIKNMKILQAFEKILGHHPFPGPQR